MATDLNEITFVFLGTDSFAVTVLDTLKTAGLQPELIVTTPDTKQGRGLKFNPSPVAIWAERNEIHVIKPLKLNQKDLIANYPELLKTPADFWLVAAYGKILPAHLIEQTGNRVLNIHPSLLPKYRGPAPIQSAILAGDNDTGVTIMLIDEEMDHGPILDQAPINIAGQNSQAAQDTLARAGAELLIKRLPDYLADHLTPHSQNHNQATYTKKITRADGLLDLADRPEINYQKFLALTPAPGVYFFQPVKGRSLRIKITAAHLADGQLVIDRIIPEGKKEMAWADWSRNIN